LTRDITGDYNHALHTLECIELSVVEAKCDRAQLGKMGSEPTKPGGGEDRPEAQGRKPNPMDVHVGSRVRLRRMVIGMSQEKLGEKMSLTFQQIQKYEKGTNRIGASRLYQLAQILDVPVQFFFEDAPHGVGARNPAHVGGFAESRTEAFLLDFLNSRDGLELNRAFVKITDPKVRKRVVELVRALSDDVVMDAANLRAVSAQSAD
jgi:transcriptional regulator with XRE-family HTH domain